ncbi:MAG: transposase, partial [Enterococcus sp.]|nr:transposase [Enterococcus sp.]
MKKRYRYGTVLVDFHSHKTIDLLDSRNPEEVSKWLKNYPNITIVSRDGSKSYKSAVDNAHPHAIQVSDRFHLIQNLTNYSKHYLMNHLPINVPIEGITKSVTIPREWSKEKENRQLTREEKKRRAEDLWQRGWRKTNICRELNMDPRAFDKINQESRSKSLTKSEQQHVDVVKRKEKLINEAFRLRALGYSYSAISKKLGINPATTKSYLTQEVTAVSKLYGSKRNGSILSPYYKDIDRAFEKGLMASKIEQLIREKGYEGSSSLIRHYVTKKKKERQRINEEKEPLYTIERKYIIQLLYHPKEEITQMTTKECDLIFEQYPFVKEIYHIIHQFKKIMREHDHAGFLKWFRQLEKSPYKYFRHFVIGTKKDLEAVIMAVLLDYSNGLVEGSINKIKVIKRIMYG